MNTIYLDPEKTSALEPFEWEIQNRRGSGISPFSVPLEIHIESSDPKQVRVLRFMYSSGSTPVSDEVLDSSLSFGVKIWLHSYIPRITRMEFAPELNISKLRDFASKMQNPPVKIEPTAKRFSYQMIGKILEAWADVIVKTAAS